MAYNPPIPDVREDSNEYQILGWCNDAIQEADGFIKAQIGYDKIPEAVEAWLGQNWDLKASTLSLTTANHFGKIANDMAALLTDVKPFWDFRTYNKRFEKNADIFGKLSSAWYTQRQIDVRFSDAVKYYLVAGTGWVHPFWNEGTEDLDISADDPRDVLPIRPTSYWTAQDAMGVLQRRQRTVNYLRDKYPSKASRIQADRDGSYVAQSLMNTRAGRMFDQLASPFRKRLFGEDKPAREMPRIPTVDLYTLYVTDTRRNRSGNDKIMGDMTESGEPATNWSYRVKPGELLYPRKRCIIFTSTAVLYDGPSIYWHGLFPYCKLTLDALPWSWLGKSPLWDILPLQKALNQLQRVIGDWSEKMARLPRPRWTRSTPARAG